MTAARSGLRSRFSMSSTTPRTTRRAVSRVFAGMTFLSESSVATSRTSGVTAASISGSSSICCKPRRWNASVCTTCTTELGKYVRMSPSQRTALGADEPSPAPRSES